MATADKIATLSAAFRQLSDALHLASVACKDLEYTLPLLASSKSIPVAPSTSTGQLQLATAQPKRVKDPNEPKRPPSSYLLFQKDARKRLAEQDPDLKPAEAMTKLAALWNELNDSGRKVCPRIGK